jgi:murein DD-endopeptidase MepM/ murein hydrolase activator NlpD
MKKIVLIFSIAIISIIFIKCSKDNNTKGIKTIEGVVTVTYPAGLFISGYDGNIQLEKINNTATQAIFNETSSLFQVYNSIPYQIKINCSKMPENDIIEVALNVSDDFIANLPQDYGIELFAQVYQDGGEELLDNFEILESSYNPSTKILSARLPSLIFTNKRTNGKFEAILTVAATPGINNQQILKSSYHDKSGGCLAAGIICPIGSCEVSSPFTQLNRNLPELNQNRPHLGTDFRAPVGTQVLAVADGIIEEVRINNTIDDKGKIHGYGLYIIIRHGAGATLYGHLFQSNFAIGSSGQIIKKGDVIGLSGGNPLNQPNSGGTKGPHLHFEYVPNGKIIKSKNRIDPVPCIGNTTGSSLIVGDNGNLADDAFEVYLNGILLGQTEIGGYNNISLSNLVSGLKELSIKCIIAPDDAGTLEITLNDGITFADGTSQYSGVLTQGEIITKTIIIPKTKSLLNNIKFVTKPNKFIERHVFKHQANKQ